MPIKPELRQFYGKEWKMVTRPRILARAGHKCESCGVPNRKDVLRAAGWWSQPDEMAMIRFWYRLPVETCELFWTAPTGGEPKLLGFPRMICRRVIIVLTVAHLNHTPGDDRDENLKALCQWCHLNYDKQHHHESRAARKDLSRPLLNPSEGSPPGGARANASGQPAKADNRPPTGSTV